MKKIISLIVTISLVLTSLVFSAGAENTEIPVIRKPRAFGPVGFSFLDQYYDMPSVLIDGQYANYYLLNVEEGTFMQSLYDGVEFYYFKNTYNDWKTDDPEQLGMTDKLFKSGSRYYEISNFGITPYPTKRLETGWEKGLTWEFNQADGEISYADNWRIGVLYKGQWTLFAIKITKNDKMWEEGGAGIMMPYVYQEEIEVPVIPSTAKVMVDGKPVEMESYNIEGYNCFKVRDVAMALKGTRSEFGVEYYPDKFYELAVMNSYRVYTGYGIICTYNNRDYVPVGGELTFSETPATTGIRTNAPILFKGGGKNGNKKPQLYTIGGYNYCKIRDIAEGVDFALSWDEATGTILIDSTQFFTE